MAQRTITTSPKNLWVYGLDLPREDAFSAIAEPSVRFDENDDPVPWPMAQALGVEHLDHDFVEPAFIGDMTKSVADFVLEQTQGDAEVIAADKDRLNAVKGAIIMISHEPGDDRLSRTPDAPFYFLGVYPSEPYSFTIGTSAPARRSQPLNPTPPSASASRRKTVIAAVLAGVACIVTGILQMVP